MHPKDADRLTNSVEAHQTLLQEKSDLGLHCLDRPVSPNTHFTHFYEQVRKLYEEKSNSK